MSRLSEALSSGRFVITSELTPPKGTDLGALFSNADILKDTVDAFNVTDSHAALMSMCPLAVSHLLIDRGIEPILQVTTRDRNRIAIQSDLLGASALGIENVVFMGGDPPKNGDHPEAKPVFDMFSSMVLEAAKSLNGGADMMGNALSGSPKLFFGAVVNPGADDLPGEIKRMEDKLEAGASFLQTQAVYEPASFEKFVRAVEVFKVPLLAGIIPLKSVKMAEYMNSRVPGINIPDALIAEISESSDRAQTSIEVSARIIREIRAMCSGLHIMPIGWEDKVPAIIAASS